MIPFGFDEQHPFVGESLFERGVSDAVVDEDLGVAGGLEAAWRVATPDRRVACATEGDESLIVAVEVAGIGDLAVGCADDVGLSFDQLPTGHWIERRGDVRKHIGSSVVQAEGKPFEA